MTVDCDSPARARGSRKIASTGNPNGPGLPEWPAFAPEKERILELGATISARDLPNKDEHVLMDQHMAALRAGEVR